jgi:hypothetical protein
MRQSPSSDRQILQIELRRTVSARLERDRRSSRCARHPTSVLIFFDGSAVEARQSLLKFLVTFFLKRKAENPLPNVDVRSSSWILHWVTHRTCSFTVRSIGGRCIIDGEFQEQMYADEVQMNMREGTS